MADRNQSQQTAQTPNADAFPTPTPVAAPPTAATKENPALPIVKAAIDQGWQYFDSGSEEAAKKQRQLVARAGKVLGVKTRTKTHKEGTMQEPQKWYMLVTRQSSESLSGDTDS